MTTSSTRNAISALVTPLADGRIDELALRDLIEWQIEEGSFRLAPCGTTGESPIGNDLAVALAASAGQLRLNAMEPVIVLIILQSMRTLTRGMVILKERCIDGIEVGVDRTLLDQSLVLATPLASLVEYSKASNLSQKALVEKSNFRDVVEEENVLTEAHNKQIFGDAAEFANVSNNACG